MKYQSLDSEKLGVVALFLTVMVIVFISGLAWEVWPEKECLSVGALGIDCSRETQYKACSQYSCAIYPNKRLRDTMACESDERVCYYDYKDKFQDAE